MQRDQDAVDVDNAISDGWDQEQQFSTLDFIGIQRFNVSLVELLSLNTQGLDRIERLLEPGGTFRDEDLFLLQDSDDLPGVFDGKVGIIEHQSGEYQGEKVVEFRFHIKAVGNHVGVVEFGVKGVEGGLNEKAGELLPLGQVFRSAWGFETLDGVLEEGLDDGLISKQILHGPQGVSHVRFVRIGSQPFGGQILDQRFGRERQFEATHFAGQR